MATKKSTKKPNIKVKKTDTKKSPKRKIEKKINESNIKDSISQPKIMAPELLFKRMMIVIPIILFLGLISLLHNEIVGYSLIFGGIIGGVVAYFKYKKIKERDYEGARNTINHFFVVMGLLLIFIGFFAYIFQREQFNEFVIPFALGLIFLIYGLMSVKHKNFDSHEWKSIPIGFKLIMIFYSINVLSNILRLDQSFNQINLLFGLILSKDLSIILNFVYFLIPIIIVFLVYEGRNWKILMSLFVFLILNSIALLIKIRMMTLPEIIVLANLEMPNESVIISEVLVKNVASLSILFGIMVTIIIAYYVYKKRDYFE